MSDSVRPHRRQPTRLPRPWDSPGKNTGGGCHFLLQCMKVKSESEVAQSCPTPSDPMDWSLVGSSPWDFPGKSTGVGCHCFLRCDSLGRIYSNNGKIPRLQLFMVVKSGPSDPLNTQGGFCVSDFLCFLPSC